MCAMLWFENTNSIGTMWAKHVLFSQLGASLQGLTIADVDGDNNVDIISSSYLQQASIWQQNTGKKETPWNYYRIADTQPSSPSTLLAADMDGDKDVDILVG